MHQPQDVVSHDGKQILNHPHKTIRRTIRSASETLEIGDVTVKITQRFGAVPLDIEINAPPHAAIFTKQEKQLLESLGLLVKE